MQGIPCNRMHDAHESSRVDKNTPIEVRPMILALYNDMLI